MRQVQEGGANRSECIPIKSGSRPRVTISPNNMQLTLTGPAYSFRWAAPEIMNGQEPDLPSDIWAFGWICWEVCEQAADSWFLKFSYTLF